MFPRDKAWKAAGRVRYGLCLIRRSRSHAMARGDVFRITLREKRLCDLYVIFTRDRPITTEHTAEVHARKYTTGVFHDDFMVSPSDLSRRHNRATNPRNSAFFAVPRRTATSHVGTSQQRNLTCILP